MSFTRMYNDYLDPDRAGVNDEHEDNMHVRAAFRDYDGPYDLYREVYRSTGCGPSIGMTVRYWSEPTDLEAGPNMDCFEREIVETFWCDELRDLGSWDEIDRAGMLIEDFRVSSIVEGVDAETSTVAVPARYGALEDAIVGDEECADALNRLLDSAIEKVDDEVNIIWCQTHGCDRCAQHWSDDRWETGYTPIWDDCPECGGDGVVI